MNAFALLALQLGTALPTTPMDLIRQSTIATKIVLVLLGTLSLISWAIMLAKWREFRRADVRARAFEKDFASAHTLEAAAALVRRGAEGPFASIVSRASNFVAVLELRGTSRRRRSRRFVSCSMPRRWTSATSSSHFIPWLATIGSASPLIGLLGTVLGVIDAFVGIAVKGSGNLAAVAPGVAEALVATAAALTVAIPAVFGYNIFATRLNRVRGPARELRHLGDRDDGARRGASSEPAAARPAGSPLNAEINVVSLIDVMMLLMVIFMITAPIMQGGVDVALPQGRRAPAARGRAASS